MSEGDPIVHPVKIPNLSPTLSTRGTVKGTFDSDRAVATVVKLDLQHPDLGYI